MQKHVNLVDLVKSFPTNIFLQNLASIQKRRSPIKFAHLAEKSEQGSISNLSTKVPDPAHGLAPPRRARGRRADPSGDRRPRGAHPHASPLMECWRKAGCLGESPRAAMSVPTLDVLPFSILVA